MPAIVGLLAAIALSIAISAAPAAAQETGGSSGHGDLFGDLVHVKRDAVTGQPILQKRWIEYPQDLFDWGYCAIPVDAQGNEIPFAPLSCDVDPASLAALVEVDYFGRLSAGRTKPRNIRMHFDEVIEKIKAGQVVDRDAAGRLKIATGCTLLEGGGVDLATCTWKTVDSPQENLAVYNRILRYGHLQTDPLEVNADFHGDPALPTQYYTALAAADYAKFQGLLVALLPTAPEQAASCFGGTAFTCDDQQALTSDDFVIAASFLGGAADKTGTITTDLIQYMHRILKLGQATPEAPAALDTLPALVRDCGTDPDNQLPAYHCLVYPAPLGLPPPADERFVNFGVVQYDRLQWFSGSTEAIKPTGVDTWAVAGTVVMRDYLSYKNPGHQSGTNVAGYVNASLDAVRAVEFMHNYEVPADLGWDFATVVPDPAPVALASLSADPAAPQRPGTTIRFTAVASGGIAPLGYKWWLFDGAYWTVLQGWSASNTVEWTPTIANADYVIGVWVRDGDSLLDAAAAFSSLPYAIEAIPLLRVTSLTADATAPQVVGTTIHVTAVAEGGTAPYEYKWWLFDGTNWTVAEAWSAADTFTWIPAVANDAYRVGVWVRSAGSTEDAPESLTCFDSIAFPITPPPPLTVTGITADLAAPQLVGTTVRFTAVAAGGTAPYQYRWWVYDGLTWTMALDWTPAATYAWTPLTPNAGYRIGVWVRSAGSTQDTPETLTSFMSVPFAIADVP